MQATEDSTNRPLDVVAAGLSSVIGLFMGIALFSHIGLFLVPLTPVGLYVAWRASRATRGAARGLAYAGILLNLAVVALFLYAAIRYLVE